MLGSGQKRAIIFMVSKICERPERFILDTEMPIYCVVENMFSYNCKKIQSDLLVEKCRKWPVPGAAAYATVPAFSTPHATHSCLLFTMRTSLTHAHGINIWVLQSSAVRPNMLDENLVYLAWPLSVCIEHVVSTRCQKHCRYCASLWLHSFGWEWPSDDRRQIFCVDINFCVYKTAGEYM